MPNLDFHVESANQVPHAAEPILAFRLRITNKPPEEIIHTIVLRAQIQLDATRRKYNQQEQERLRDLFGAPDRWSQTLRNMLWTHASIVVTGFKQETTIDLPVPCTFDFNVAATKYFHGLDDGDLPLIFLFSGTVFYEDHNRALQVAPISWDKEAKFKLPVSAWRELMESHYPNSAWLSLRKDVFDRLYQFKVRNGIPTWEQAVERVMDAVEEPTRP